MDIFAQATVQSSKPKSKSDKTLIPVDQDTQDKITQYKELSIAHAQVDGQLQMLKGELIEFAKEKYLADYRSTGSCPESFYFGDELGKLMFLPAKRYRKIKDEDDFKALQARYPSLVEKTTGYKFNPVVLARNMEAISKAIVSCEDISQEDKASLIMATVSYSIKKEALEQLARFEHMELAFDELGVQCQIKNVGK